MIEVENEQKGQKAARALVAKTPPSLMIERYFTSEYCSVMNARIQNFRIEGDVKIFPKNPFKPATYGPLLRQLIPNANSVTPPRKSGKSLQTIECNPK